MRLLLATIPPKKPEALKGLETRGLGFRVEGFRGLGFRVEGLRV